MQKIIRRRRGAKAWRELVSQQAKSGLSAQAFCRREGISAWSFYGWRSRLRADLEGKAAARGSAADPESGNSSPGFIDLGALGSPTARFEVRLDLGGGVLLHLVRG